MTSNTAWNRERFWLLVTAVVLLLGFAAFLLIMTRVYPTPTPRQGNAWHQQRHRDCLADPLWTPAQRAQLPGLCEEDGRKWCAATNLAPDCYTDAKDSG